MNILFITWDGPQTSYLEGLFIPIFKKLNEHGYRMHILQFTWADEDIVSHVKSVSEKAGIPYRSAPVRRSMGSVGPLASAFLGSRHIRRAVRDWSIDTLMPRSLMPALAVVATGSNRGLRLVFDADGFAADERVDFGGLSKKSVTYRIFRAIEANTTRLADRVLVRTPRAIDILVDRSKAERAKFHVVSNGRDPEPFNGGWPQRNDNEFRLCYAGSLGPQYRPIQMLELAQRLRTHIPELVFHVFTGDHSNFESAIEHASITDRTWIKVSRLPPKDMPAALLKCDMALALRQPAFSTQAVSPIKLGEYMLAGLPVIGTEGVGAVQPLIDAGVMFPLSDDVSDVWPWVRDRIISNKMAVRERAQQLGLAYFSLHAAVNSYLHALDPTNVEGPQNHQR